MVPIDQQPICDIPADRQVFGMQGGLYPGASNAMPTGHLDVGCRKASGIIPRNELGEPDDQGVIVFLAVGMSNAGAYFRAFRDRVHTMPELSERIRFVDATLDGPDIPTICSSPDPYWRYVMHRVTSEGFFPKQVQAVWFMQAVLASHIPVGQGPAEHMKWLETMFLEVLSGMKACFPNLQQVCSSAREYGGYASPGLGNPEPYAWYTGWAWKRLIERQIDGDLHLDCSIGHGQMPWLGWSGYFWADGPRPRKDGLSWKHPEDFEEDGVHPTPSGVDKASGILVDFYRNDPVTQWMWRS